MNSLLARLILFLDGEYGAVNAIFTRIIASCLLLPVVIEFVKLAAAGSFMHQANDIMTSFRTLKDLITKHEYRRKITDIILISASIWQIQSIFKQKK